MALPSRRTARLGTAVAALAALAAPAARANVSGNLELQGQSTQNATGGAGRAGSSLLMETLSLHYAGIPFGPDVAIATLGGGLSNASSWPESGARADAQVYSFDASVGFLPRRAVPLRLYGSGSVDAGTHGALAVHGAGPSLLYGGQLNLEPGPLPGIRLDASESRSSREGLPDLSDVQRRLAASSYGTVARQRVNLSLRLDDDHRERSADVSALAATLTVSSEPQQTTLVATQVRRSIPNLAGINDERALSASGDQRWSRALATQLGARWTEARATGATGSVADARAGVTWTPLSGAHQLTLAGGGSVGMQRIDPPPGEPPGPGAADAPDATGRGHSYGGSARVGYAWIQPRVTSGLSVGAAADVCDCTFGNEGLQTIVDTTVSLGLPASPRLSGQTSYTLAFAYAPIGRGGDRVEQHARANARLLVAVTAVTATLSYDDAVRDVIVVDAIRAANSAASVHERAVGGSLGAVREFGAVALNADVRHTRGRVLTDASDLVGRAARQARTITSGQGGLTWRQLHELLVQAQAIGTWTTLDDSSIGSFGANATIGWRVGLITTSLQYQATRYELVGTESSFQQYVRALVSRPFDL
jgi:hypothetical protein